MPTNILKLINDNIDALSEDLVKMHQKIDALYTVFYQSGIEEKPITDGDTPVA